MRQIRALNMCLGTVCALGIILILTSAAAATGAQPTLLAALACTDNRDQNCPQGSNPEALIQASDGNFYGAANRGGSQNLGAIFKVTPGGQLTLLFSFAQTNGALPGATLVEAPDGTLWGTTFDGGKFGLGVIFKINKDGTGFRVVQNLPQTFATAFYFGETLIVGKDGNLYGSTIGGGTFDQVLCPYGCGTFFRINPTTGAAKVLHLLSPSEGSGPSGLIQATDGNFYGANSAGVFRITPAGGYQIIAKLPGFVYIASTDGGSVGVIQASNGNLFGVLQNDQAEPALYELALDGSGLQVFPGIAPLQFSEAISDLLQAADGSLWLTSYGASTGDPGSLVQLSAQDGSLLQNIPFDTTDGDKPAAHLIQGRDKNLYGTTKFGGVVPQGNPDGVVFSLSTGQD